LNLYLDLKQENSLYTLNLNILLFEYICGYSIPGLQEIQEETHNVLQESKDIIMNPFMSVETDPPANTFLQRFDLVKLKLFKVGIKCKDMIENFIYEFESLLDAYSTRIRLDTNYSIPLKFINLVRKNVTFC
jgi:hypothetical protein